MRNLTIRILTGAVMIMALQGCASSAGWYHLPSAEFDQIDYGYPVKTAQIRNIKVGYIDQGRGEVVVLIHGLGTNAKGWTRNIPALAQDHRVIALDLPGYGYSDKKAYPYSMSFYATVLKELLDGLGIGHATLVGHSMGGQIAMVAALEHPDMVDKLVLISPAGFETFTDGEGDWMRRAVSAEFVKDTTIRGIAVNLKSNFRHTPPEADFMITDRIRVRGAGDFADYCTAVSLNVAAMLDRPVYDDLEKITQPVLVMFGEEDNLIPNRFLHGGFTRDVAALGMAKLPDAKLVMLEDCGHFVQFEQAERGEPGHAGLPGAVGTSAAAGNTSPAAGRPRGFRLSGGRPS